MGMRFATFSAVLLCSFASLATSIPANAGPAGATVSGKVTFTGTAPKFKPLDVSKEPPCVKMHESQPLYPETVVAGPGNSLRNVVVYVSGGAPSVGPPALPPAIFDQQGCHYTTHVLAFRVGQEVKISNSDPFSHNIHPIARINREWNKIQPPGVPPFSYAYEQEEFIPVKCNIHPWMQGYFAVLKNGYFAVTDDSGHFNLPELPPGHYTLTAWHESFGTRTQEITVSSSEPQTVDFVFAAKP
jgi:hypothetical protein